MNKLVKIDDVIEYLKIMKEHGEYVSEAEITTPGRAEYDNIDINIRIPAVNLEKWAVSHKKFFENRDTKN